MPWRVAVGLAIAAGGYYAATHTIDVPIYRDVGRQVLAGDYNIYPAQAHGGFRYAPITALLFVPLALMPLWLGALLIYLLKVGALFVTSASVTKLMGIDRAKHGTVCLLAFLTAGGYLVEDFRTGNVHFLSLLLVVAAFHLIESGRKTLPSVLLALAVAFKLTPLLLVFYYGLRRRFAIGLQTLGAFLALLALPAVFVGIQANTTLLAGFIESASQRLDESRNHSLRGVLFRFLSENTADAGVFPAVTVMTLPPGTVTMIWYALSACLIVGVAVGIVRGRRDRFSTILEYALLVTIILVVSPHSLRMYFSTLFLPFCVLTGLLVAHPAHPHRRFIITTLALSFGVGTLMPLLLPSRQIALTYEALSPHLVVAGLVCASLAVLRWGKEQVARSG